MRASRVLTTAAAATCIAATAILAPAVAASAATPAPAATSATAKAPVAPVTTLHIDPDGRLGGRGITGATVVVTDRVGTVVRTVVTDTDGWWFASINGLQPQLRVTQVVAGTSSTAVTWGTNGTAAPSPVNTLHLADTMLLGGRAVNGAVVTATDEDGHSSTTQSNGFFFVPLWDLHGRVTITQEVGGQTSAPAYWTIG
ncbi:hypothetical protein Csp2054_12810 [Curtobacterium sp. 'Ferrero']|uniref:hypothetical protein n=1 Tax=Curtobacterium sp. 'Ferrero' TaxID=2033654 RepID=UPI000BC42FEB|nr:hypothetical protein [Curtobacterium sp. 'Ferrero']PCN47332.1 hypothetical protein Csp2054_12810 [Curtobacterium sp. 'Ferrero']